MNNGSGILDIERERLIALTIFESKNGIFVCNKQNCIIRVNQAFTDLTGYTFEDVVDRNPNILASGRHHQVFYKAMWNDINEYGAWEGEITNKKKEGVFFLEYLCITVVKDNTGEILNYIGTFTDITTVQKAALEIQRLAFYDPLTGLANRLLLRDRLKQALIQSKRDAKKGAILFIDLDNFKVINDTKGHDKGDILLKQIAIRLEDCVRSCDTVARIGGDEFVIIINSSSVYSVNEVEEQAEIVGKKVLSIFTQDFDLNGCLFHCSPSIGITLFDGNEKSIDEPMKQADIAMYQAKELGKNRLCFFNAHMQVSINMRVALEKELTIALEENQLQLFYQSQIRNTNQVVGAEALIRWHHPLHGLLLPDAFIWLAEKSDLILSIGEWILNQACAQLKQWGFNKQTQLLTISVNISAKHFSQPNFVDQVIEIIRFHGVDANRLKIEIVESLMIEDVEESIDKMGTLRSMGVRFAIDDFGTGYSSLSYLTRLPLDQLKIDKSFIHHIGREPFNGLIVQSIIGIARSLGLEVIAEGVETYEQLAFLEENHCFLYQGYYFSHPVSIEQFLSAM